MKKERMDEHDLYFDGLVKKCIKQKKLIDEVVCSTCRKAKLTMDECTEIQDSDPTNEYFGWIITCKCNFTIMKL